MGIKEKTACISAIFAAAAGLMLSAALIMEYHGSSAGILDSLCRAGAQINTCKTVASSPYAAIRGLPLAGDLPVALFGFIYYGISAFLAAACLRRPGDGIKSIYTAALITVSSIAVIADIGLFIISYFVIQTLCNLCTMTYAATAVIFTAAAFLFTRQLKNNTLRLNKKVIIRESAAFRAPAIALIVIIAAGMLASILAKSAVDAKIRSYSNNETTHKLIRAYEKAPVKIINTAGAPMLGGENARVSIVIFSDFTCDHCAIAGYLLEKALKEFGTRIKVYYKNYPLAGPCSTFEKERDDPFPEACMAACASRCAYEQGAFAQYYKGLYYNNGNGIIHTEESVTALASEKGLDVAEFRRCLASEEIEQFIMDETAEAKKLGIDGTPTVYINNKEVSFAGITYYSLVELIRYVLNE